MSNAFGSLLIWIGPLFFLLQSMGQPLSALPRIQTVEMDCTVYYTPKETGFVASKGFDLRPCSKPGLECRLFAADFLRAVHIEGHGLLAHPQRGLAYIYFNGSWGYTNIPKGAQEIPLQGMRSCAVSPRSFGRKNRQCYKLDQRAIPSDFSAAVWQVVDVGSSVGEQQIDLYWGEDNPRGPGADLFRPAGTEFTGLRQVRFLTASNLTAFSPKTDLASSWGTAKYTSLFSRVVTADNLTLTP